MALILLPTDFSDDSLHACAYALDLFGTEDNRFLLLNAYLDPVPANVVWAGVSAEVFKAATDGMERFLVRFRALKNADGAQVRTQLEYGPLAPVVAEVCAEQGVDVVVLGTSGRTGFTFLGSNASEVAKHGKVPVLVVPEQAKPDGLRRILFADDHQGVEPAAMRWLVKLARRHAADVVIAHVMRDPQEEPDPSIAAAYEQALGNVKHRFLGVPCDDPVLALSAAAERDGMDLVVVLHRHLGWLDSLFHRSTTKHLAMYTHVPLLVLQH